MKTRKPFPNYFFARIRTRIVLIKTTVMELRGIKTAAIRGLRFPEIAKLSPTMLYKTENIRQIDKINFEREEIFNKSGSWTMLSAAMIASEEGVKWKEFSDTAIPTFAIFNAPESFRPSPSMSTFLFSFCKLRM